MATTGAVRIDPSDPAIRRLVYSRYRDMLGTYHGKANSMLESVPASNIREDRGIKSTLEAIIRSTSGSDDPISSPAAEGGPPPPPSFPGPPPPPPPGFQGALPTKRLTTEIPDKRLEPPACVQNAMMTKDKKPFTYTPGGLDLSQIRSPRMARRIVRNANSEGVTETPRPSPLAQPPGQLPPTALAAMQPQLPVQVFPTGPPAPPPPPPMNQAGPPAPPQPKLPSANSQQNAPQGNFVRPDIKIPANPMANLRPTQGPYRVQPDQPQLHQEPSQTYQAPPQTYQPPPQPYQSPPQSYQSPPQSPPSPPQASPQSPVHSTQSQLGSLYIPPITQAPSQQSPQSPPQLSKAPTPWMHQQRLVPQEVPSWVNREPVEITHITSPPLQTQPQNSGGARVIPIHIEGRDPPRVAPQSPATPSPVTPSTPGTRVIPIQIEGALPRAAPAKQSVPNPVYIQSKFAPTGGIQSPVQDYDPRTLQHQQSWGNGTPNQSRSFRVLQKITDTINDEELPHEDQPAELQKPHYSRPLGQQQAQQPPTDQVRKLQLTEDDRALMNKFKSQVSEDSIRNEEENPRYRGGHIPSRVFRMLDESVDEENFLHSEEDPRYRGAAIPSKAFRMLQSMTGSGTGPLPASSNVPRGPAGGRSAHQHQRPVQIQDDDGSNQPYIPASEQQVLEPRKYTGGAIPSRSFRMLQAMTAPENYGPGQSDL